MSDLQDREGSAPSLATGAAPLPGTSRDTGPQGPPELALLILEHSVDGVMAHTLDGRLVYFNDMAAQELGYTRNEFAALGRADHAMYRAKQAGESGWEAYLKEA
jgi:PAS domain-containing protein